jgi:DNA-directed RNA polymerase specialized sigma24 family protein
MTHTGMTIHERAELTEANLLLRWAATRSLSDRERYALSVLASGMSLNEAAALQGVTSGCIWMAQQSALKKIRRTLERAGIHSSRDLCSRCV